MAEESVNVSQQQQAVSSETSVSDNISIPDNDGLTTLLDDVANTDAEPINADQLTDPMITVNVIEKFNDFMQIGGPVVWVLMVFSVIALAIVIVKLIQFFFEKPESSKHLEGVLAQWQDGKTEWALSQLDDKRPIDEVVKLSLQGQHHGTDNSILKEELQRVATNRINRLSAYLRPLEVIATLSPLLGLLGTVLGMIEAFQQMQAAGSQVDPSVLSGGIWKALLTTAVGLTVAIPVMMLFNWMERKVERVATLMNDTVTRTFTAAPQMNHESCEQTVVQHVA